MSNVSRTPTADEINALPKHVRDYIHWLATDADPGHTLQRNYFLEQENAGLRSYLKDMLEEKGVFKNVFERGGFALLEAPIKCGSCQQAIEADLMTGTRCGCTALAEHIRDLEAWSKGSGGANAPSPLPQAVMQTEKSHNEWPADLVDNAAIRQCMYRAEADFHKGSKSFLTKREQGHIMGLFRNVVAAFVNTITQTRE